MKDLLQRFKRNWKEQGFVSVASPFLLAMSGGIDSMVLANLLYAAGIRFCVAHCNFSLRAEASDKDAELVMQWCTEREIPVHLKVFDTKSYANTHKVSTQVAARNLRYTWFAELCKTNGYAGVLTAHHADDVAETVLMNLCKGTGISGLHGILPMAGLVFRPLLFASKQDIVRYAQLKQINWREDASNAKMDYLRNAMRLDVLPKIDALLPGAAQHIADTAQRISEAELIYRPLLQKILGRLEQARGRDVYVPLNLLKKQAAKHLVAFELFSKYGFAPKQIQEILNLELSESGSMVCSDTHRVIRHREFLVITTKAEPGADLILIDKVPTTIHTSVGAFVFSWKEAKVEVNIAQSDALLDADKIQFPLVLRTRKEADYFYPLGMGMKKKKLKKFLIDQKLSIPEKEQIRVLEMDQKILWIAGLRIDERFKVTDATQRILCVRFQPI